MKLFAFVYIVIVCTATRQLMIGTKTESKRMSQFSIVRSVCVCISLFLCVYQVVPHPMLSIQLEGNSIDWCEHRAGINGNGTWIEFVSICSARKSCYLCKLVFNIQ